MGTRSGNPLWKNSKSGNTPITAEALNNIEDALDEAVYADSDGLLPESLIPTRLTEASLKSTYATAPDGNKLVKRLPDGRAKAAAGTETDDVVTLADLPAFAARKHASPVLGSITPPQCYQLRTSGPSAWFGANYTAGVSLNLSAPAAVSSLALTIAAGSSGNFEVAIYARIILSGDGNSEQASLYKVATTGVVDAATVTPNAQSRVVVPLLDPVTLPPGHYAVVMWCSSTGVLVVNSLDNNSLAHSWGVGSFSCTGGLPETSPSGGNSGRLFLVTLLASYPTPGGLGKMTCLGDSITQNGGWPDGANALLGGRYTVVKRGIAGQQTDQMLARVNDVIADNPAVVAVLGGANDLGHGVPPATTIANLAAIVNAVLKGTSAQIRVGTVLPRGAVGGDSPVATMNASRTVINAWIRSLPHSRVAPVDWSMAMSTGDDATYNPALFGDHVHPNTRGSRVMQAILAATL